MFWTLGDNSAHIICMVRGKQTRTRRPNKALRHVRGITGLGQKEFAKLVRTSPASVQKIEDGTLKKMPYELAVSIMALTGASPESLAEGSTAKTIAGRPFTLATYKAWRSMHPAPGVVEAAADRVADLARALVLAAYGDRDKELAHVAKPARFREVLVLLSETLEELGTRYHLIEAANRELAERAVAGEQREVTFAQLKELLSIRPEKDSVPFHWNKERAAKVADHQLVKITEKRHPLWQRPAGAVDILGSIGMADLVLLDRLRIETRLPYSPRETTVLVVNKVKANFIGGESEAARIEAAHQASQAPAQEMPKRKRDTRRQARRSTTKKEARK
jgi:DNA-binding XRE family transcriptional regulator